MSDTSNRNGKQGNEGRNATANGTNETDEDCDNCDCPRSMTVNVTQEPPAQQEQAPKPYRDWKDKWEIRLLWVATLFAIAATAAAGIAAYFAREQVIAARKQVRVAEDSLAEVKTATRKELRAYVFAKPYPFVNGVREGADTHTRLNLRNSGNTPASDLEFRADIVLATNPPTPSAEVFLATKFRLRQPAVDPKADIYIGPELRPGRQTSAADITAIRNNALAYYVWGVFLYRDVFNDPHHSYFCFVYNGLGNTTDFPKNPDSAAQLQGNCPAPPSD